MSTGTEKRQGPEGQAEGGARVGAPFVAMGNLASETFERLARQHYAVVGDFVDFTLAQMRIPTERLEAKELLEAQIAESRSFAGKARQRMEEYVAIAGDVGERLQQSVASTTAKPAGRQLNATPSAAGGTPIVPFADTSKPEASKTPASSKASAPVAAKSTDSDKSSEPANQKASAPVAAKPTDSGKTPEPATRKASAPVAAKPTGSGKTPAAPTKPATRKAVAKKEAVARPVAKKKAVSRKRPAASGRS